MSKQWRRGDSNPKHTKTEQLHVSTNYATDYSEKLLEGSSEKKSHDTSEHFNTLLQHQFGVNMVRDGSADSDLTMLEEVWPELPEHIKAAIKALIQSYIHGGK